MMGLRRLLNAFLPLISLAIFFLVAEGLLWGIGFEPSVNRHGVEIPFWASHAGTFDRALDQLVLQARHLTDDVNAYRDDLTLFYRLRPNIHITVPFYDLSGKLLTGTFPDWDMVTDGQGRRCSVADRSSREEPADGDGVHIAVMGGSSMFGWGTDYENTCAAALEARLRQDGGKVLYRVTNHAVPGYAMSQQLRILQTMVNRGTVPDWIVLDATSNCDVPVSITDHDREKQRLSVPGRLRYYLSRLKLFNLMEMGMIKLRPRAMAHDNIRLATVRIPLDAYPTYVDAFVTLARKNDISLILVGLCADARYVGKLAEIAHNRDVPMVDVYALFQNAVSLTGTALFARGEKEMVQRVYPAAMLKENPSLYFLFPDECHPNPTGHRLIAGKLAEIIRPNPGMARDRKAPEKVLP